MPPGAIRLPLRMEVDRENRISADTGPPTAHPQRPPTHTPDYAQVCRAKFMRLAEPDKYSGTGDVAAFEKFELQLTEYIALGNLHGEDAVRIAALFLIGNAYSWWVGIKMEQPRHPATLNLSAFLGALYKKFLPGDPAAESLRRLCCLKQGRARVSDHNLEFKRMLRRAVGLGRITLDPMTQRKFYISSLTAYNQRRANDLCAWNNTGLEELMMHMEADDNLQLGEEAPQVRAQVQEQLQATAKEQGPQPMELDMAALLTALRSFSTAPPTKNCKQRFEGRCRWCNKKGHKEAECRARAAARAAQNAPNQGKPHSRGNYQAPPQQPEQ